jgi:predicted Zn-ribbon and HTH transcriptional regulator
LIRALSEVPLFALPVLGGVIAIEAVSRFVLKRLRSFVYPLTCDQCGYCLRGLADPRCPECGMAFEPERLDPPYTPIATPRHKRFTTLLVLVVLVCAAAWPIRYRAHTLDRQLGVATDL